MNSRKRVLVVDDEPDIREGASRWLGAAGYATLMAEDGERGVESAQHDHPDAILLDMLMPRRNGIEMLACLRSRRETADIPVVMLSASLRDEQQALDAGARYFLHKPYDGKRLVCAVTAAIAQGARS